METEAVNCGKDTAGAADDGYSNWFCGCEPVNLVIIVKPEP